MHKQYSITVMLVCTDVLITTEQFKLNDSTFSRYDAFYSFNVTVDYLNVLRMPYFISSHYLRQKIEIND